MTVAVIGLGDLGLAFALRLHESGCAVVGVDVSADRRGSWQQATGQGAAGSLDGLAAERVFVCVRTTGQAREVLASLRARVDAACGDAAGAGPAGAGAQGLAAYVVTTLNPVFARGLAAFTSDRLRVIELPVSGGRAGARQGELTVLVGGGQATGDDVTFVERTLARRTFEFPRFGDATVAKLLNNTVAAYNAAAFSTALALAEQAGLPADVCADVVRASSGGSWIADSFGVLITDLLAKDAGLLAAELGPLPAIEVNDPDQLVALLGRGAQLLSRPAGPSG